MFERIAWFLGKWAARIYLIPKYIRIFIMRRKLAKLKKENAERLNLSLEQYEKIRRNLPEIRDRIQNDRVVE